MNIREEIKYIIEKHFDFEFETKEVPLKRSEFIDLLTEEFMELLEKVQEDKIKKAVSDIEQRYRLN